jgi:RNA 2',3'-cyclic 3'-phosphodiesterase
MSKTIERGCGNSAMSECTRTFIAIALPEPVAQELARLQTELSPEVVGCQWTSTRPFHITIAFLGDVPDSDLNQICQTVTASTVSLDQFEVDVHGLGAFPNASRPRVVWAGVTATNINALNELQESVVGSLERVGHGPDDPRFHPHVTLGRIKHSRHGNRRVQALIERWADWSAGGFTVTDVFVMASILGRAGPRYKVLGRCPLDGKKP